MTIELGALSLPISVPRDEAIANIRAVDKAAQDAGKAMDNTAASSGKARAAVDILAIAEKGLRDRLKDTTLSVDERARFEARLEKAIAARAQMTSKAADASVAAAAKEAQAQARAAAAIDAATRSMALQQIQAQKMDAQVGATTLGFTGLGNRAGRVGIAVAFGMEAMANGTEGGMKRALRAVATFGLAFGEKGLIVSAAALGLSALLDFIHRAEKEADEAYKRLKKKADDLNAGPGGQESVDLDTVRARLATERSRLATLRNTAARPAIVGTAAGQDVADIASGAATGAADDRVPKILEQERVVAAIEAHVRDLEKKSTEESVRQTVSDVAKLAGAHQLSANELKNAIRLRTSLQQQLAAIGAVGGDQHRRGELVDQIKQLDEGIAGGKTGSTLRSADLSMAKEHADAVNRILAVNEKAQEDASDEAYRKGEISLAAHYATRERLIKAATARELETLRGERAQIAGTPAATPEEAARRRGQLQGVDDRIGETQARGGLSLAALGRSRAGDQERLDNTAERFTQIGLKAEGTIGAAAKARIDKEVDDYQKLLTQQGALTEAELQRFRTVLTARENATETEKQLQEQLAEYETARAAIHERINTGQLTELEGARELNDLAKARLPAMQAIAAQLQAMAAASNDPDLQKLVANLTKALNAASAQLDNPSRALAQRIVSVIRETLTGGLADAFSVAFSGGGASGFFASAGKSILAGLGKIMVDMGEAMIPFGTLMTGLQGLLTNPFTAGPGAIAIGIALIAMGSALGAAARGGGSGGGASGIAASASLPSIIDRGIINPSNPLGNYNASGAPSSANTSAANAAGLSAKQPLVFNVIGINDPVAQRQIQELIRKANGRGGIG